MWTFFLDPHDFFYSLAGLDIKDYSDAIEVTEEQNKESEFDLLAFNSR